MYKTLLFVIFLFFFPSYIFAQTPNNSTTDITVGPSIDKFNLPPGETVTRIIFIENTSNEKLAIYPTAANFTTDNDLGEPVLFEKSLNDNTYALASWITFKQKSVDIFPGERTPIEVVVTAPDNAEPGGHYGAVLFSTKDPESTEEEGLGIVAVIGTLMLVNTPGEIVERLEIEKIRIPRISFSDKVRIELLLKNSGNTHVSPRGTIHISDWSDSTTKEIVVNDGGGNILPESNRSFSYTWDLTNNERGAYNIKTQIFYGHPEVMIGLNHKIIIVPPWIVIAISLIIVTIILSNWRRLVSLAVRVRKFFYRKK